MVVFDRWEVVGYNDVRCCYIGFLMDDDMEESVDYPDKPGNDRGNKPGNDGLWIARTSLAMTWSGE